MRLLQISPLAFILALAACSAKDATTGSTTAAESQQASFSHSPKSPIAQVVTQTNLVSDQPDVAKMQDTNLVNAWGLAFNPTGFPWISDNGTGVSTVYDVDGR